VPRGAKACPHCGADERAGWNEDAARYDGLDLPDAAFAEDQQAPTGGDTPRIFWAIVVVGPLILVLYALIFR
jgi:hypothetical protein